MELAEDGSDEWTDWRRLSADKSELQLTCQRCIFLFGNNAVFIAEMVPWNAADASYKKPNVLRVMAEHHRTSPNPWTLLNPCTCETEHNSSVQLSKVDEIEKKNWKTIRIRTWIFLWTKSLFFRSPGRFWRLALRLLVLEPEATDDRVDELLNVEPAD